jgi:hypothetical protein
MHENIIKFRRRITYIDGTMGAKCGKLKLIYHKGDWIDSETGEVFTALIRTKTNKLVSFVPMLQGFKRVAYVDRKNIIIKED